jgi:hypothetical protein
MGPFYLVELQQPQKFQQMVSSIVNNNVGGGSGGYIYMKQIIDDP